MFFILILEQNLCHKICSYWWVKTFWKIFFWSVPQKRPSRTYFGDFGLILTRTTFKSCKELDFCPTTKFGAWNNSTSICLLIQYVRVLICWKGGFLKHLFQKCLICVPEKMPTALSSPVGAWISVPHAKFWAQKSLKCLLDDPIGRGYFRVFGVGAGVI